MVEPINLLRYLSRATRFGGRGSVPFSHKSPQWAIEPERLATGLLEADMTREILTAYQQLCPATHFGENLVPVVICLRWFVPADGSPRIPLLLASAKLDVAGILTLDETCSTWIPWERLDMDGTTGELPTVCTLDALRVHQEAMEKLPDAKSWSVHLERATTLFDAVCGIEVAPGWDGRVEKSEPVIRIWDQPDATLAASAIMDSIAEELGQRGSGALTTPVACMIDHAALPSANGEGDELTDDELLEAKLLCGVPDHIADLSATDRAVLLAFARQRERDLLLCHAPEGTNAEAVALAAMANHITGCALRGERAPVVTCVAPDATIARLRNTLGNRPVAPQTSLPSRWLPRIAHSNDSAEAPRVLGPLHSAVQVQCTLDHSRRDSMALHSVLGHPTMSDSMSYCDTWYIPTATTYFLDCVSGFLGRRVPDVATAAKRLSERLRLIDQDRCDLIDSYSKVCQAAQMLGERDRILTRIGDLRGAHTTYRQHLSRWQQIGKDYPIEPPRRGVPQEDQAEIVLHNTVSGEVIPQGKKYVAEVCAAYVKELQRIEEELTQARDESTELTQRARVAVVDGQRCAEILDRLQRRCALSTEQAQRLNSAIDGRAVSMGVLNDRLDETVRPSEFWLAIHIYEAQWLTMAHRGDGLQRVLREGGAVARRAESNLCTISLVPFELSASVMSEMRGARLNAPVAPVDLTVVLRADELDVATGIGVLGSATRAFVLGSEVSLGPCQPMGCMSDEMSATTTLGSDWNQVDSASLSASGSSSTFRGLLGASHVQTVALYDVSASYGELDDLRSDLRPSEPVRASRIPSNSADDPSYALFGIVPALSHVLVPDSSWQQMGSSRQNRSEAMALARWLTKHGRQVRDRYEGRRGAIVAVLTVYREQQRLLRELLADIPGLPQDAVTVLTLREAEGRTWPLVLASAVCGPTAYVNDCACDASAIMSLMAATAQDALVLFWGGAWLKSDDTAALTYLRRATMVGRLYSVVRSGGLRKKPNPFSEPKHMDVGSQRRIEVDLRAKPLSLTALLHKLHKRGDLPSVPSTSSINVALQRVGLIERVDSESGARGWRPTPAGREIGILGTSDRLGNPFCSYGPSSEAVVASTALTLLDS